MTRIAVLSVTLEKRGTKHHGQVIDVHLVTARETLHTETHAHNLRQGAGQPGRVVLGEVLTSRGG